jgi:hypothetical protein
MSNDGMKIKEQLSVHKEAYFNDNIFAQSNITITNDLNVIQKIKAQGTLSVASSALIKGGLSVLNNSEFTGDVNVSTNFTLSSQTILTNRLGHYDQFNPGGENPAAGDLDVYYETVKIHGNLDVVGNINQSSVSETDLYIEDKQIYLGVSDESYTSHSNNADGTVSSIYYSSNHTVLDSDNNLAGIVINGIPDIYELSNDTVKRDALADLKWKKSLTFNCPGEYGMNHLAYIANDDTNKIKEPYWKFKGGHLRIEGSSDETVSFAFRINSKQQLELVKVVPSGGQESFQTIAKFGAIIS